MDSLTKAAQDGSDPDFAWEDYLEETQAKAAPPTAFSHVEESLVSTLKIGMKLEVTNPEEENCYWVASVVMICGPLLSLRYLGYGEDRSADFWFDLISGEFHTVGWCAKNGHKLYPPKGVRERHENFMSLIVPELEADTIPTSLLESPESGITPIDQIKMEMLVEISEEFNYGNIWLAKVIQNVGGRLLLRYLNSPETGEFDFWLFYLSERLHPIGWAKENGACYIPPKEKQVDLTESEQKEVLAAAFKEDEEFPFPAHILEPQQVAEDHGFKENMKLEVLDPHTQLCIRAATVTKVISSKYFIVEVDNLKAGVDKIAYPPVCCSSLSLNIFPCKWAKENGLDVVPPDGYTDCDEQSLDWDKYLTFCQAVPAPQNLFHEAISALKFEVGMKLEAVAPSAPDEVHAATVIRVVNPLLWIQFDSAAATAPNRIVPCTSFEIFPVGWCASNAYPLQTPVFKKKSVLVPTDAESSQSSPKPKESESSGHKGASGGKSWCPKIYFNHCCFTGPYLSKSRLAELPQAIGPGPLHLVMQDVLTRLINIAYKSCRVLKELQICGKPNPNMLQQTIKAKYKGKSYCATVEFIRNSEQIEEFCHSICRKLDCCPHLFGPNHVGKDCPENCYNLTKTKFSNGFMKKQKKSNGTTSATDDGTEVKRGPGRRKKRKHWRLLHASKLNQQNGEKKSEEPSAEVKAESPKEPTPKTSDSDGETPAKKKLIESNPADSKIVTRGAKLPNFAIDKPWKQHTVKSSSAEQNTTSSAGLPAVRKVGRPLGSTKKAIAAAALTSRRIAERRARDEACMNIQNRVLHDTARIGIPNNPLEWSVNDVVKYIRSTPCAPVATLLRDQEIDGQALLMLTLYSVQEFLHLKHEPAKVFCSLIENLKYEFFMHYAK